MLWGVVDDHVVEESKDNDEIGLRGFDINLFGEDKGGDGREELSEYHYLLISMKLWNSDHRW